MKVSYSAVEVYNTCAAKYKFKYIDRLEPDKTFSALLFGRSIDEALNYVLHQKQINEPVNINTAIVTFDLVMDSWFGQNEFLFFKNECPEEMPEDKVEKQFAVHSHLKTVGHTMIKTYVEEVLPLFSQVIDVQIKHKVENNDGDELVLIIDFIATLASTGETIVFDNKTSSDIKKNYNKNCVKNSTQLAIYSEYYPHKSGYIAMSKKLIDGKIKWDMIVDMVPEEKKASSFDLIGKTIDGIKAGEFPKNTKACFSFGRLCDYTAICKYANLQGLYVREPRN